MSYVFERFSAVETYKTFGRSGIILHYVYNSKHLIFGQFCPPFVRGMSCSCVIIHVNNLYRFKIYVLAKKCNR